MHTCTTPLHVQSQAWLGSRCKQPPRVRPQPAPLQPSLATEWVHICHAPAQGPCQLVLFCVFLRSLHAASPTKAVFTSFWEYHQARGRANGTPAQASPRVKIASDDGADGSVQSGGYDYGAPSFTATTAGLTVPSCAEDDLIFAK